jgi:hypothetical protein
MDEVSNFCSGDICKFRAGAPSAPFRALSRAELRDDPPWVGAEGGRGYEAAVCHYWDPLTC